MKADMQARREVSELVSSMVDAGGGLPLPEDRLLTIMEAAQVSFVPLPYFSPPYQTHPVPACGLLFTCVRGHTKFGASLFLRYLCVDR